MTNSQLRLLIDITYANSVLQRTWKGGWMCFLRRLHEAHEGNEVVPVSSLGNYLVGLDNEWNFESILKFAAKSNFIHYRFSIT
jgi:hypothetical protein